MRVDLTLAQQIRLKEEMALLDLENRLTKACERLGMPAPRQGDNLSDAFGKVCDALEYAVEKLGPGKVEE